MASDKMRTKDGLVNELKLYQGILSDPIFQYLNSLIESDVSVIRKNKDVTDKQKRILSAIDIYEYIAIYNICGCAKKIFLAQNEKSNECHYNERRDGDYFNTYIDSKEILLFWYHDQKDDLEKKSNEDKTMPLGKIQLYKTIWNEEMRILEIDRIKKELAELYAEYENCAMDSYRKKYVIPDSIKKYEAILAELENRHEPTKSQEKIIDVTSCIHDLFIRDYGLSNSVFKETQKVIKYRLSDNQFMQEYKQNSEMEKVLVKRTPNFTIESHITYL